MRAKYYPLWDSYSNELQHGFPFMYGRVNLMVFELPFLPMLEAWLPVVRDRCMTNDHKTSDWQARDMARVLCIMFQIFIKKKVSRFRFGQNYENPERSKNLCYSVIPSSKSSGDKSPKDALLSSTQQSNCHQ